MLNRDKSNYRLQELTAQGTIVADIKRSQTCRDTLITDTTMWVLGRWKL